ncbi:glycosyltransferase [Patescibacteria group bacterium]|nr:glycosyltransferase [Patescibacteria group bacterium]
MNIAIHNPMFAGIRGLNGWALEFILMYKPIIYISHIKYVPRMIHFFYRFGLNPLDYEIIFSTKQLNKRANVLLCFNGAPHLERNRPVKDFKGLKIYHVTDYWVCAGLSNKILKESGVDYIFGYAKYDTYCDFFQSTYTHYKDKVLPIPFGFASRLKELTPFEDRKNKVIALGSVNSFHDVMPSTEEEFYKFFLERDEKFMHKFRRMLVENEENLSDIMDSKLPHFPEIKDFGYNLAKVLNEYKMFVNCESLLYFPSGKTFEGPASGAVLVCSDHPCYSDLGFEDGVNCIKHKQFDVKDFRDKVSYYVNNPEKLRAIQENGTKFVREKYNHKKVAEYVHEMVSRVSNKEVGAGG